MGALRVLVISHMYPTASDRVSGCFIEEQIEALALIGVETTVISPQPVFPQQIRVLRSGAVRRFLKRGVGPSRGASSAGAGNRFGSRPSDGFAPAVYRPKYLNPRGALGDARVATFLESCVRTARTLNDARFDLVHAHTALLDGSAGAYLASRMKVPLVITEHMGPFSLLIDNPIKRRVTKEAYARAARIVAVSRFLAGEISSFVGDEIARRVTVIGNGYTERLFRPDPLAIRPSGRDARYLLFVGYFEQNKRIDVLIEAFRRIAEERPSIELHLIGGGKAPVDVEGWIRALRPDVARRAHVHGMVDRETVALYMQQRCDVLVLPSEYETFGVVVIEALASGKPVVATRSGGPEDTVSSEVGELVPVGDPGALAEAIRRVLDNLDRYDPAKISDYARAGFSYEHIASRVRAVYEEALEGRG
jgi:glycosyltransferase involved in cell wall biosynthesis